MSKPKYNILSLKHSQNAEYLYFLINDEDVNSVSIDVHKACVIFEQPTEKKGFLYVPIDLLEELDREVTVFEQGDLVIFNTPENLDKLGLKEEEGVLMRVKTAEKEEVKEEAPKEKPVSFIGIGLKMLSLGMDIKKAYEQSKPAAPKPSYTNINDLADQIHQVNRAKGFWDKERNTGEMLMLVTSELGEAMEAHRKGKFADWEAYYEGITKVGMVSKSFKEHIKDSFEDELADATIRLLDMAAGLNINLEKHIQAKLDYNRTRARFHGKEY